MLSMIYLAGIGTMHHKYIMFPKHRGKFKPLYCNALSKESLSSLADMAPTDRLFQELCPPFPPSTNLLDSPSVHVSGTTGS